ncbi:MAG: TonB family protein [Endomicrobium sp.]|jgi:TonB family protein|nr:TonB family protein [Endomicrobium sp.]
MSIFNPVNISLVKGLAFSIGIHAVFFGTVFSYNTVSMRQDTPSYIEVSFEQGGLNQEIICPPQKQQPSQKTENAMQTKLSEENIVSLKNQNEIMSASKDNFSQNAFSDSKNMQQTMDCCKPSNTNIKYDIDGSAGSGEGLKILRAPKPFYPQESRKSKEEGEVIVAVAVSPEGKIQSVNIAVSSGFSRLDEAALKAAKKIRLSKETINPDEEPVTLRVPYKFKII